MDEVTNIPQDSTPENSGTENMSAEQKRMFKLLVDGQEEEYDEDSLKKLASKARGADKKFDEAAMTRKQTEQLLSLLKENPFMVLEKMGIDPTDLSKKHLTEIFKKADMTPEQLAQLEKEERLRKYEEQEKAQREQQEQQELILATQQVQQELDTHITNAIKEAGLPTTRFAVSFIAGKLSEAFQAGYPVNDKTIHAVAKLAKSDYFDHIKQLVNGLDDEGLEGFFGQDMFARVSKAYVKKTNKQPSRVTEQPTKREKTKEKPGSATDFYKKLRNGIID